MAARRRPALPPAPLLVSLLWVAAPPPSRGAEDDPFAVGERGEDEVRGTVYLRDGRTPPGPPRARGAAPVARPPGRGAPRGSAQSWAPSRVASRLLGQVRARGTRSPVPGARVTAASTGAPYSAVSDVEGRYALELPPGIYRLRIEPPGGAPYRTLDTALTVRRGETVTASYYLPPAVLPGEPRFEAVVRGAAGRHEEISRHVLHTEELRKIPGTFGDPLRAIENLPGAARAPFNTGLFIIEGGRPTDSRVYLAGAEVPQLYHYGGLTSVVPGSFLAGVDYLPHNFSARYGRAVAGTIDIDLRPGRRDRLHGALDVNMIHAGAELEGPIGRGSFLLGVRRSYIDGGLALVSKLAGDPPGLRFTRAPVYWDYQAALDYPLGGGHLRVMALGSDDQLSLRFARPQDVDPSVNGQFSTHIMFHRLQTRYRRRAGAWDLFAQNATGYNATDLSIGRISLALRTITSDFRLEGRRQIGRDLKLLVGAESQSSYVVLDAAVPAPLREGEFQRPPGALSEVRASERGFITNVGVYTELRWQPHERIALTPGWRGDYFSELRRWNLDPRLSARARVSPVTWLKLGAGLYTQDPPVQDYFGTSFGNPRLRLERATHVTLGVEQAIWRGLVLEITGIYKHLWDLSAPSRASRRFATDSGDPPPGPADPPAEVLRPERVASAGTGRIYGGTVMLRQSLSRYLFGWISYSLLRSERRDCPPPTPVGNGCDWRLFDFDQTHVLVIVLHAYLPYSFEVGLRYRYVSGVPYTLARGGIYDSDADLYQPRLGPPSATNAERLGAYNQLDLRIDRTFTFKKWLMKVYLDVSNIYNNPAPEQTVYSFDYIQRAALTGLPILPSLGVRAEL